MANPNPSPSTRFQAGNCANPRGRPKGRSITERIRSLLDKEELDGKPLGNGRQIADLLAAVVVKEALKGDFRFVQLIVDRLDGKTPDRISIGTDGTTQVIKDYLLGAAESPAETG